MAEPAFSVFNDGYAAEVYEAYRLDPASVDESWRQLFRFAEQLHATVPPGNGARALADVPPQRAASTPMAPAASPVSAATPMPAAIPVPAATPAPAPADSQEFARIVVGISRYLNSIRRYGYLAVPLDPLGTPPPGARELTPEHYGITPTDLDRVSGTALGFPHLETARDVAERLKYRYTRNLAVEFVHCRTEEERQWFRETFTAELLTRPLSSDS